MSKQVPRKRTRGSDPEDAKEFTEEEVRRIQCNSSKKLGPEFVSSRSNGTHNVAYLEGAKAFALANEIFGFNGWSSTVGDFTTDYLDINEKTGRVNLGLSVMVRVTLKDGTFREDIGYGIMENARSKGAAFEKCKKEAITDALKRALRQFGNALGNCLYDNQFTRRVARIKVEETPLDEDELYRSSEYKKKKKLNSPATTRVNIPAKIETRNLPPPMPPIKTEEEALRERERESLKNNLQSADFLGSDDMDDYELSSQQQDDGEDDDSDEEEETVINPINEKNETELLQFVHGSQAPMLQEGKNPGSKFDTSYQTPDIKRTILHDKSVPILKRNLTPKADSKMKQALTTPDTTSTNSNHITINDNRGSPAPGGYQNPLKIQQGPSGSPMVGTPKIRYNQPPLSDKGLSALNITPLSMIKNPDLANDPSNPSNNNSA